MGGAVLLAGAGGMLAWTNPGPAEFADFAAGRLVEEISSRVCESSTLPSVLGLPLADCAALVASQRNALGAVVQRQTRRTNFGVLSVYHSQLGGQQVLRWRVPRFEATVVGVAGRFVIVQAREPGS
ncbi:DUF4359 domain-containing protein [Cyanobium sp. LEGE 06143]|uniref:DUF4359 domain-containing protein n=1 Tax=Cyanobium sp. LEGE 06143 TaxID=945727 RepID=UPI0018823FEA|nr:DUF4359 domain-containing protein [Cyanobium sp. LEGE 06143]